MISSFKNTVNFLFIHFVFPFYLIFFYLELIEQLENATNWTFSFLSSCVVDAKHLLIEHIAKDFLGTQYAKNFWANKGQLIKVEYLLFMKMLGFECQYNDPLSCWLP